MTGNDVWRVGAGWEQAFDLSFVILTGKDIRVGRRGKSSSSAQLLPAV